VTAELGIHLEDPVTTKTVRREPQKSNIHGTAAIAKPQITEIDAKRRGTWCDDHKTWTTDDWNYVIWSGESSFTLFPTSGRV
jgi:Transposase.